MPGINVPIEIRPDYENAVEAIRLAVVRLATELEPADRSATHAEISATAQTLADLVAPYNKPPAAE